MGVYDIQTEEARMVTIVDEKNKGKYTIGNLGAISQFQEYQWRSHIY